MSVSPEYEAYMRSSAWRAKRAGALERAGHRCQYEMDSPQGVLGRCPSTLLLDVHHLTYIRFTRERPEDLEVHCWFHHMTEHLLQVECPQCGSPLIGSSWDAEAWLAAELRSLKIDLATVRRSALPTKDDLVTALLAYRSLCDDCDPLGGSTHG